MINLSYKDDVGSDAWTANIGLRYKDSGVEGLESKISDLIVFDDQWLNDPWGELLVTRHGSALDDPFAAVIAESFRRFIEVVAPMIDQIEDEINGEDA